MKWGTKFTLTMLVLCGFVFASATQALAQNRNQIRQVQMTNSAQPGQLGFSPSRSNGLQVRIKDVTTIQGLRNYTLQGFGLVTGLNGTGGTTPLTRQSYTNYLERGGMRLSPESRAQVETNNQLATDNVAFVQVTAKIPSFAVPGTKINVTVTALDNATSLFGGELTPTSLRAIDGEIYAQATGDLVVGGFSVEGEAAKLRKNHPTKGNIVGGAIVEREVTQKPIGSNGYIVLLMDDPDHETATRIKNKINEIFPHAAIAANSREVRVMIPPAYRSDVPRFVGEVNALRIRPDSKAIVVVDEANGTIVIGKDVKVSEVAITHANISVSTIERPKVNQPNPLANGQTVVVPQTQLNIEENAIPFTMLGDTPSVGELVNALNALGATPPDLIAILRHMKETGALHAELRFK